MIFVVIWVDKQKMGKIKSGNNINLIQVVFIIELRRKNSNIDEWGMK